ncbi:MAG: glycosyltransferase family 39 protein [Lachnospiraceae bacterium]|nr:glycosyltransferase family 39 protein [Lachnospiraceae bacterium]
MKKKKSKLNKSNKLNLPTIIIFALGIFARLMACILAKPDIYQHDVKGLDGLYGHLDYAVYIFKNWRLADTNYYEFAQPPVNATLQALCMKIVSLFKDFGDDYIQLYSYCKILTFIYSVLTLIIIYKIIKEFDLPKIASSIFLAIMALYPGLIVMTTQYSNDCLSYLFFYLSLYLGIRWAKTKKLSTIICLALSIGFGMLTKVSVGLIAFIVGPMMLIIWIKSLTANKKGLQTYDVKPSITVQLIIFALIVFPLGLSYSIRNYVVFGQGFGEISDVVKGSVFDMTLRNFTFAERYLTFAFSKLYDGRYDIFHDWTEYNIWVDLVKTSAFDEFQFRFDSIYPALYVVWFLNIVYWFIGTISIIYNTIVMLLRKFRGPENVRNLRNISLMLYFLAFIAFLSFNLKYPNSPNSNWRYVAYITFGLAGSIICMFLNIFVYRDVVGTRKTRTYNPAPKNVGAKLASPQKPVGAKQFTGLSRTCGALKPRIVLLIVVAVNLFLFSSVSPIHSIMNMQYNEWLYYLIGKGMTRGMVPYLELLDHKGPYLFFFFALANVIEFKHISFYLVALAFYYIIALFSYKITYLTLSFVTDFDEKKKTIFSFISGFIIYFISSSYYLSFGTISAEVFIIALMLVAYYIFIKYLFSGEVTHRVKYSLIYGALAGVAFFIKANGILGFVPIAITLLIILIRGREVSNLLQNILFGFIGFVISLLPAIIYCIVTDSLAEMIEGAFVINFLYTGTGLPSLDSLSLSFIETIMEFKEFVLICILSVPAFYYIIKNFDKETKTNAMTFYILSLAINIYSVFMSVRPYTNYLNYLLFYIIPIVIFFEILLDNIFALKSKTFTVVSVVVLLFINLLSYSFITELSNLNGYAQERLASQVMKVYKGSDGAKNKPKMLVIGYAPYLYEAFGVLPNEQHFATPVVSRKKYGEPYNAIIRRIERGNEELIIVAFERSMKNDEEFKSKVYSALENGYEKIGDASAVGTKAEIYRKVG